ncbi:hypothetical protein QQS21_007641 [Conoideocrella luteorostrata]|uniref:N-acetyltransferase domain-containing protein n=1 Tax=Conoideocrella luteorostrata TaxID=1105319 RepID=A0AAJ0CKC4_9HYPO|nr:hypothetical protein QQS21_007641 [Conoideocrella luteorostrata]
MAVIIRKETPSDVMGIEYLTRQAFRERPNKEEQIVNDLRAAKALKLSLVAAFEKNSAPNSNEPQEQDESIGRGQIVGHVAFSPVRITATNLNSENDENRQGWIGLGPLSVDPSYQRQGIGTRLVQTGLQMVKDSGARGCVLLGNPRYYERFGFENTSNLRVEGVPQKHFMVLAFRDTIPRGTVSFHDAFSQSM